ADKLANRRHISFCELAGVGENITFFPPDMSATEVVDYWYSEHNKYEYETPGWQAGTNYFTQLIWKSTREVVVDSRVRAIF
ncbi:Protein F09B9.5, partial [Aphelenchoides avenae]